MITVKIAAVGMVINHEVIILRITRRLRVAIPLAKPTPIIDPTMVWVVEIGMPNLENISTVVAVENSAVKPRVGVISVIFLPIVSITLYP